MTTQQQTEALSYFKHFADDWERKAQGAVEGRVNVIQQRNGYVLDALAGRPETRQMLDVGCGTGDLVIAAARQGVPATGIDFAEEMIAIAQGKAVDAGLTNATFICASIFEVELAPGGYDLISANGFIEYISYAELDQFLTLAHRALSAGGSLVMGSRNRLFNLFSLNSYTEAELEAGCATALLEEALAVASDAPLASLAALKTAPLQAAQTRHASTGIEVSTRYQFTPAQLIKLLHEHGFEAQALAPIHIHGVPPAFKAQQPLVHTQIANLLQRCGGEARALIPFASSFMVHARRR